MTRRILSKTAWVSALTVAALSILGPRPSRAQSAPAPSAPPAASETAPAAAAAEEPWLYTEDGRAYRLEKLDKTKVQVAKISPTIYRTTWGTVQVDREDATYLYYRVYREVVAPPTPTIEQDRQLRAAEVHRQLPPPLPETDRLEAVDFGRGLPTTGQWRNSFEFADMNEDGFLDLVHGTARKGNRRPNIFLGNGKGDWRLWTEASYPQQTYEYGDVTVGDFNGDHHLDIFFGAHLLGLQALLGDGKGGFTAANEGLPWRSRPTEPLGFSSQQVQVVNWPGSKTPQVLALSEGPKMSISPGQLPSMERSLAGVRLYRNVSKDRKKVVWEWVNANDKSTNLFGEDLQLAPGRNSQSFVVGSGNMNAPDLVFEGRDRDGWHQLSLPTPRLSYYWSVAPLRRAGLSTFDVVAVGMSSDAGLDVRLIDLYRREAKGWVRKTLWSEEAKGQGPIRVATADVDGNGFDDVVALGASGQVWILLQESGDKWLAEQSPEMQGLQGCLGSGLRVQDLDGDGRPEIAISWSGEADLLLDPKACPDDGSLRVWKLKARASATKK